MLVCPYTMLRIGKVAFSLLLIAACAGAQEMHDHGVPAKLGTVSFPISCAPAVQDEFNHGVALMHSFAYPAAEKSFEHVAAMDPKCGMAHWGIALTYYHQLWSPFLPASPAVFATARKEMMEARRLGAGTPREKQFLLAVFMLYQDDPVMTPGARMWAYEEAMAQAAHQNPDDLESQVFYALSMLAIASPADKTHAEQKKAIDILNPLYRQYPNHPGIAHYLIHASDSQELAQSGLAAARAYARIAPDAPHALHMPSHTFTRLGLWNDSIQSNLASRKSAREQGDQQQELHAMDYLVYAYLQTGRDDDARQVVQDLKAIPKLDLTNFAIAYASTAMPIRIAIEREQWADAASISAPVGVAPSVVAIAVWAKGLGLARTGHAAEAREQAAQLRKIEATLQTAGDKYWSTQTGVLAEEVLAWSEQADGHANESAAMLRTAADQEDALEKLPVTPGPIVPAREQLGDLLLLQNQPALAVKEFQTALAGAPNRQRSLQGLARAQQLSQRASVQPF